MRARSSSSWGPKEGSSRAALRSSSVAATSRNSDACPRSQSSSVAWAALMWLMNSSVTWASATSVMSSFCLDEAEQQVEAEKTSRCTSNAPPAAA